MAASSGIEEKKAWEPELDDIEPAPDSAVRPTSPPPSRSSVAIGSIRPTAPSSTDSEGGSAGVPSARLPRSVTISFAVSPALMALAGADGWYLTVARTDGPVLFEGFLDELGTVDVVVSIPCGTRAVKALLESATKYKDAVVAIDDLGAAHHTFV